MDYAGAEDDFFLGLDFVSFARVQKCGSYGDCTTEENHGGLSFAEDFQVWPAQVGLEVTGGGIASVTRISGAVDNSQARVEAEMISTPGVVKFVRRAGYIVSCFGELFFQRHIPIVEAGVNRAFRAVILFGIPVGHELRILGFDVHLVQRLVLLEVWKETFPVPAFVAQRSPAIIIVLAATDIHEVVDST